LSFDITRRELANRKLNKKWRKVIKMEVNVEEIVRIQVAQK